MKEDMALILVLFTMLTHAAPRCVDIFDVSVKTATQEEYLKNYLALNMAFPQYRSTISVGLTAFYFARDMKLDLIYKPLSKEQETQIYAAMLRAHSAMGIEVMVPFDVSQLAFATFTMTLPIRVEKTLSWLDTFLEGRQSKDSMDLLKRYSQTISMALRSAEARELSHRFRAGFKDNGERPQEVIAISREEISVQMRELVVQKLIEAHPELSTVGLFLPKQTLAELLYEAMN